MIIGTISFLKPTLCILNCKRKCRSKVPQNNNINSSLIFQLRSSVYSMKDVLKYVLQLGLTEFPLLHGIIQKETDTERSVYYNFIRTPESLNSSNQQSFEIFFLLISGRWNKRENFFHFYSFCEELPIHTRGYS